MVSKLFLGCVGYYLNIYFLSKIYMYTVSSYLTLPWKYF